MPDLTKPFAKIADVSRKIDGRENDKLDLLRKLPTEMLVLAENLKGWEEQPIKEDNAGKRTRSFLVYDVGKINNEALRTFTHLRLNGEMLAKAKSPLAPTGSTQEWTLYAEPTGEKS